MLISILFFLQSTSAFGVERWSTCSHGECGQHLCVLTSDEVEQEKECPRQPFLPQDSGQWCSYTCEWWRTTQTCFTESKINVSPNLPFQIYKNTWPSRHVAKSPHISFARGSCTREAWSLSMDSFEINSNKVLVGDFLTLHFVIPSFRPQHLSFRESAWVEKRTPAVSLDSYLPRPQFTFLAMGIITTP